MLVFEPGRFVYVILRWSIYNLHRVYTQMSDATPNEQNVPNFQSNHVSSITPYLQDFFARVSRDDNKRKQRKAEELDDLMNNE